MATKLLDLLEQRDENAFKAFIASTEIESITEEEETQFMLFAPTKLVELYVSNVYLFPASERFLMLDVKFNKALKIYGKLWGLYSENVLWAFQNASIVSCHVVLSCLNSYPGAEVEIAMLKRESVPLLNSWLKKFHELSESGERLLHEDITLSLLKSVYIEQQICR